MNYIVAAEAAITLLKEIMTDIEGGVRLSQISKETQDALMRKIDLIRDLDFDSPEWKTTKNQ